MKIPVLKLLLTSVSISALAIFSAAAGPTMPSDTLNVFAVPPGQQPILFATGSAFETGESDGNTVHLVFTLGGNQPIPGNPDQFNHATALLDPDGKISDIFGVFRGGTDLSPLYFLAFISDPDPSDLTLTDGTFSGFGTITTRLPEDQDSYNATQYLAFGIGAVPYTATFSSDREVPDAGTTCSLFGMALTGLAFLRRKLS